MHTIKHTLVALLLLSLAAGLAHGGEIELPNPGPKDTCPVCGMFVVKYPEWIATVVYTDGHAHHFDGAKDLFKYLLHHDRYEKQRKSGDIDAIRVCSYYSMEQIPAREAWYVIGSDVFGPMGRELIPHESEGDAKEFLRDHRGEKIVRFGEVDDQLILYLDR